MVHSFTNDEGKTRCVATVQYESTNPAFPPPSVEFICLYDTLHESRGQSPAERIRWQSASPTDARVMIEVARQTDPVRFLATQIAEAR